MDKIKCKCGCGTEVDRINKYGRKKEYAQGHNNKGKILGYRRKNIKKRTSHERANKLCKKEKCFINNHDCKGPLDVAHRDGNPFNNEESNLVSLCRSHHFLMDKRKLTLKELSQDFEYRTDNQGKRRYL